jgi:hypothetical protein
MEMPDELECLAIAIKLIEEHGEMVGPVIQVRIDALRKTECVEELAQWLLIRNMVGFILNKRPNNS